MIKLVDICKYYSSDNSVVLGLRKINLEFKVGEFIALTGESGSGKSTLLNVISGIDTYEDGEMYIDGEETSYYDEDDWENYRRFSVGFIFQSYNLIDSYSVIENVEVPMIIQGIPKKERRKRALEILQEVGLESHIHHKATKLSGGQKQRLAIARAIAKNTKIIVADEPTGNLDSKNGEEIMKLLHKISKDKLVIVVTHNYEEAEPYVTRKIRLFDGEVVEDRIINKSEIASDTQINDQKVKCSDYKKALIFALYNLKNQPKKTILLLFASLISLVSIFVFYTSFNLSIDLGVSFNNNLYNTYDERIILKKINDEIITDDDINEISSIRHVDFVTKYDYALDISLSGLYESTESFYVYEGYIKNIKSISEKDLSYGTMPNNKGEIVVQVFDTYTEEEREQIGNSIINQRINFDISKRYDILDNVKYKITGIIFIDNANEYFFLGEEDLKDIDAIAQSEASNEVKQVSLDVDRKENGFSVIASLYTKGYYAFAPGSIQDNQFNLSIIVSIISGISLLWNLFVVFLVSYIVIRAIMLSRKRDYAILKTLGIDSKTIKIMSFMEIMLIYLVSYLLVSIITICLSFVNNQMLNDIFDKIGFFEYFILLVITIVFSLFAAYKYNKYLVKKSLISSLRVE